MKILLIGNLPEDRQESMRRFTDLLHTGLAARGHEVSVLTPTLRLARLGPRYRYGGVAKYLGYVDKFALFPRHLQAAIRASRPDIVHITDHGNAAYVAAVAGAPVLVTCHDLLQIRAARGEFPPQVVGWAGRFQQDGILARLAGAAHVVCVSAATQGDLLRLTQMPARRLSVIPNALNYPYRVIAPELAQARLATLPTGTGPRGFLLHVGGGTWYKNRPGLLALYAELRRQLQPVPRLVMVGPPLAPADAVQAAALGVTADLMAVTAVTGPQLEALYNLADALLFPSWAEGFGWPVAEAQACGCPVFATNRAPMTEVGGAAAIYFDPLHPAGAAKLIAAAWPQRASQRSRGLIEARRWTPDLMLSAYEAAYRQLAS